MRFLTDKSSLVRLSESVKVGMDSCLTSSGAVLAMYERHREAIESGQALAKQLEAEEASLEEMDAALKRIAESVPQDDAWEAVRMQGVLHNQALSTVLMCCFCLESYVNNLAFHLFQEQDYLGLNSSGKGGSYDIIVGAIEKMSVRDKWARLGEMSGGSFDRSRFPFQDFSYLFNFRNDVVHDKVIAIGSDRASRRYNGKFPDPASGLLTLSHAVYAGDVYWGMVTEVVRILDLDEEAFHKHYNLTPWHSDEHRSTLAGVAQRYSALFPGF